MMKKAKYIEPKEVPPVERKLKVLLIGDLTFMDMTKVKSWFKECYEHLLELNQYNRLSKLKKAEDNYYLQLQMKHNKCQKQKV